MSKAITKKHEDKPSRQPADPKAETAPSIVREDEPTVARFFGTLGMCLIIFGSAAVLFNTFGRPNRLVGIGWGTIALSLGILGLLSHAAFDRDLQSRRVFWALGLGMLGLGGILCVVPFRGQTAGLFGVGWAMMALGLPFQLAALRHETDEKILALAHRILGGVGAFFLVMVLLFGNNFGGKEFLIPYGLLLGLLGCAYLTAYVSREGVSSDMGMYAALALGGVGALLFVIALLRSALPPLFYGFGWLSTAPSAYFLPWGFLLIALGLFYMAVSTGLWSDNHLVILTRRELASFFFSPIAYLVLGGLMFVGWLLYMSFLFRITTVDPRVPIIMEPIVARFILDWPPVICVLFIVPVLTMRSFSEEWRTGTMEVLLTAPVKEVSVVISKFLATLLMFLFIWVPWGLFLVAVRVGGGQPFDYFALISFFLVLLSTGAAFVGMGVFFSSMTRNQITAAVLTFAGMLAATLVFFLQEPLSRESPWVRVVFEHISYVRLWINALEGKITPRDLLFWISLAVFWVFLTIKVLESRKWK